jgi:putative Ca2+/H+ antiporter (TMEM165/GDT1 family)
MGNHEMNVIQTFFMSDAAFRTYLAGTNAKGASLHTGFTTSFLAILVSEVGDKTFFLAMIMALRYSEVIVFLGAYSALFAMTVLSTAFGKIATSWISPLFTNIIVTVLFLFFGIKMLKDAKEHVQTEEN